MPKVLPILPLLWEIFLRLFRFILLPINNLCIIGCGLVSSQGYLQLSVAFGGRISGCGLVSSQGYLQQTFEYQAC